MKKFNVKKLFSVAGMCLHIFWGIVFTAFAACFYMFRGYDADIMDILFLVAIVEAMMSYLLWFSLREALMSEFTELRLLMLALSTISFGMLFGVPGCFVHSVNLDPVWYGSLGLTFILIIAGVIDAIRHIRREERY